MVPNMSIDAGAQQPGNDLRERVRVILQKHNSWMLGFEETIDAVLREIAVPIRGALRATDLTDDERESIFPNAETSSDDYFDYVGRTQRLFDDLTEAGLVVLRAVRVPAPPDDALLADLRAVLGNKLRCTSEPDYVLLRRSLNALAAIAAPVLSDEQREVLATRIDGALGDLARVGIEVAQPTWDDYPPTLIESDSTAVIARYSFGRWDRDAEASDDDEPYEGSSQEAFDKRVRRWFALFAAAPGLLDEARRVLRALSAVPSACRQPVPGPCGYPDSGDCTRHSPRATTEETQQHG
jgi:hypothetical protein